MMLKKSILFILTVTILMSSINFATSAATAEMAETQFSEDFEKYQILDTDGDSISYTKYDVSSDPEGVHSIINCGRPIDNDYSDTNVYPYATASVYEGNAANNLYVYDSKNNKVTGGLEGWYGYYNGGGQQYNRYNRKLSVIREKENSNESQFLCLKPVTNVEEEVSATFSRNDVALTGYSFLTARVSFETSDKSFNNAGIKITINPQNNIYEKAFDAVYFTESETDGKIDVHFNNKKVGEVLKASSEKWYTIHYRIYNGNASAKHSIKIIDDENNSAVIDVNWQDTYTEEGTFSPVNRYGIMFYANATINTQTYMNLDDIRFANEGYHEDFESYNLKKYYHSSGARLSNGAKGNMNLDLYKENGVFEGNMAYNNFIYRIRTVNEMTNPPRVYGNIPSWQGYVSEVALGVNAYVTDKWKDTCTIVTAEDRYEVKGAGFRQALMLYPKATENLKASQSVYVGMENTDFSGITTIESSFNMYNANTDNDIFKLQLTNGRSDKKTYSNNAAYSSLAYDGNSFDAIYEPLKIENGIIWFCGVNIGTYNVKTTYDSEYTIDTEKFTHSIKITNKADGKVVAEASGAMNGIDEFSFEGIAGFRYVASTPEYVDAKTENRVIIDDVHVTNQLDETVTGVPETMNLTVDTKQIIKKVSESTYGINFEWGGDPERYIAKDKNGNFTTEINQKFVEVFDDNIKLARMAGVSANWMLWKEAIGDVEDRGEMYFWHYDKRVQRYGLVEWLKSVKMADEDAKLIYTVNMPRNKPTDQRILELIGNKINQIETLENVKDLVRFMTLKPDDPKAIGSDGINWAQKRVELGITEPVEVYAWELGCELDADGQGWYRIAEYIEMCKPVIKAIREIDPDAKISVHEKTSIYYSETITRSWHNQLLNALGNDIDYLSVHNYYAPESWGDFEQYLDTLLLDIAQTPAKDKIKILLTEHSSGRNSDKTNAGYDYNLPHTLRGTLSTAEYYTKFMQRPEIDSAMYHSINSSSWALIYDNNGVYEDTAPGYIKKLFGEKGVGDSVLCTFDGYNSNADIKISAGAIKTRTGLNLFLVNTSDDKDTTIYLNLGDNYCLNKQTIMTAEGYDADRYTGVDEIIVVSETENKKIDSYKLNKRSIVLLEFTDNGKILSVDKETGSVAYEIKDDVPPNATVICAIYNKNNCIGVKLAGANKGVQVIDMDEKLENAENLKLFIWDLKTLAPIYEESRYVLR